MTARTLPRTAVGGYIKLARLPFDAAIGALPGSRTGRGARASVALDRVEARLRGVAGALLLDSELRADARRRQLAADERGHALRLRNEAEQRRQNGAQQAEERKTQAARSRDRRKQEARESEGRRRSANRRAAAKAGEATQKQARRGRLDALDTKAEALDQKDEALSSRDEAERLAEAAAAAKAERKSG
jgi:hypothetical protein